MTPADAHPARRGDIEDSPSILWFYSKLLARQLDGKMLTVEK